MGKKKVMTTEELKVAIQELRDKIAELDKDLGRQHGILGKAFSSDEEEYRRLYNNYHSRKSRHSKKEIEKRQEKTYMEMHGINNDEDEFGIRPVDERRYKGCFHSGYIGEPVKRSYVKRMTGLSLKQINIMQKRTGLYPVPPVGDKEADIDEQRRYETGDIY